MKIVIIIALKKLCSSSKISDSVKRDSIVKEYLDTKKNIRDNLLSERTEGQQLQTDLSKFYKPITETQKTTTREITPGLRPIREGIRTCHRLSHFHLRNLSEKHREKKKSRNTSVKSERVFK